LAIKKLELSFIASILLSTTNIYADYDFGCQPPKNVTGKFDELNSKLEANPKDETTKREMNKLKLEMKCSAFENELKREYNTDYKQTSSNEAIFKSLKFLQNYKYEIAQEIIKDLKSNQIKQLKPLGINDLFGLDIGHKTNGDLYIGLFTLKGDKPKYEQKIFPVTKVSSNDGVSFNDFKEPYQTNKILKINVVKGGKLATIQKNDDSEAFIFGNEIARALNLNFENKTPQQYKAYLQGDEFTTKQREELEKQKQAKELEKQKQAEAIKPNEDVLNGQAGSQVCRGLGCEKSDGNPSSNNYEYTTNHPNLLDPNNTINWNKITIKAGTEECKTGYDPQVFCKKISGNALTGYKLKEFQLIGNCNDNQHKDDLKFMYGDKEEIPLTKIDEECLKWN
jgi:hypothetical protein